jgi:hypothetical protein
MKLLAALVAELSVVPPFLAFASPFLLFLFSSSPSNPWNRSWLSEAVLREESERALAVKGGMGRLTAERKGLAPGNSGPLPDCLAKKLIEGAEKRLQGKRRQPASQAAVCEMAVEMRVMVMVYLEEK